MEKWEAYLFQPKPLDELIKTAIIVIDTNVLLAAYQWRDITIKEMLNTLEKLAERGRLKIPSQVLKEFSLNRPRQIVQLINDIESELSTLRPPKDLKTIVPVLEDSESFDEVYRLQKDYKESQNNYKQGLKKLRNKLKGLFVEDSYLESIKSIVEKSFSPLPSNKSEADLVKEAQERYKQNIPPGYKDASKGAEANNAGDYLIWYNILNLNEDVIFVSADQKIDWVYSDKQNNSISARKELVEEFYLKTGGKSFACITPQEFITLMNPDVDKEVQRDLSYDTKYFGFNNTITPQVIERLLESHLPETASVYANEDALEPFELESVILSKELPKCSNMIDVVNLVNDVFDIDIEDYDSDDMDRVKELIRDLFRLKENLGASKNLKV